jgi:hypothetical protein
MCPPLKKAPLAEVVANRASPRDDPDIKSMPSGKREFKGRGEKCRNPGSSCHNYQLSEMNRGFMEFARIRGIEIEQGEYSWTTPVAQTNLFHGEQKEK